MSTDPNPQPQEPSSQESSASQQPSPPPKKSRSPVERIIVWGIILALAIAAGFQARARFGYHQTLGALQNAMRQQEETDGELLTLAGVDALVSGSPSKSDPKEHGLYQQAVYKWSGPFKEYTITLTYEGVKDKRDEASPDYSPLVLSYETNTESSDHQEILMSQANIAEGGSTADTGDAASTPPDGSGDSGAEGSPPGDGDSSGRRRPTLERFDANGDGKITEEEAPERMKANFAEIDANGDGGIDAEEFSAIRRRRPERSERPAQTDESGAAPAPDEGASRETPAASAAERPASPAPEASNPPSSESKGEPAPPPLPE